MPRNAWSERMTAKRLKLSDKMVAIPMEQPSQAVAQLPIYRVYYQRADSRYVAVNKSLVRAADGMLA
jgi:hypothetical protein